MRSDSRTLTHEPEQAVGTAVRERPMLRKILIVDDDEPTRAGLAMLLTDAGFETITASTVPSAIRLLTDEHDRGVERAFAEHGLRRMLVKIAARAFSRVPEQRFP